MYKFFVYAKHALKILKFHFRFRMNISVLSVEIKDKQMGGHSNVLAIILEWIML